MAFVNGDKPIVGTKCKLRCLPGFSLMNPNNHHNRFLSSVYGNPEDNSLVTMAHQAITCAEDGQWKGYDSASRSVCVSTSCPQLPVPEHGTLFPDTCLGDNVPLNAQCLVLCAAGFYPKNGRIRTCSRGFQWFPEDNPLCIKLPPTPRPYIHCPSDVEVDLKPGQASAYVKIPQPQANMDWYRYVSFMLTGISFMYRYTNRATISINISCIPFTKCQRPERPSLVIFSSTYNFSFHSFIKQQKTQPCSVAS